MVTGVYKCILHTLVMHWVISKTSEIYNIFIITLHGNKFLLTIIINVLIMKSGENLVEVGEMYCMKYLEIGI